MQRVTPNAPYSCLTVERIEAIESGIGSFNLDYPAILRDRVHLYEAMTPWEKAFALRPWLVRHILEALSGDENALVRNIHNMVCIQFDQTHLVNIFRLQDLVEIETVAGQRPFYMPKIIRRAEIEPRQEYLIPPALDENGAILPLSDLESISIGYYVRENQVVELYFIDQDSLEVKEVRALGLLEREPVVSDDGFIISDPTPEFELKDSEDEEEAE